MARPRYTITAQDKVFVAAYLERRLREPGYLNHLDTTEAPRAAKAFLQAHRKATDLNAWAEQYLNRARWDHLKDAVRQQRRRTRAPDRKTLTITKEAWRRLRAWAAQEQITLSEVIERHLPKTGRKSSRQVL
jgi:macrodomain Ter protein organizer (MatP/YcbG family)